MRILTRGGGGSNRNERVTSRAMRAWWIFLLLLCAVADAAAADFTIMKETFETSLVGFGVQMNPYLYATPNWGGHSVMYSRLPGRPDYFQPYLGDVTPENV